MDPKPLVSVIVPLYNGEKYINRCLDSLKAQTYPNCEFIVVNDGSQDLSLSIAEGYALEDSRFKVLTQLNMGVAAARNTGLNMALGDYIAFVDHDDYVDPSFISLLAEALEEHNAEVAMCDYKLTYASREEDKVLGLTDGVEADQRSFWLDFSAKAPMVWNKLYTRQLISRSGANFVLRTGEDGFFNTALAPYVERAVTISAAPYHYVQRSSSLMRQTDVVESDYTFVDAFLEHQVPNESLKELGRDIYQLLCAFDLTALLHSAEAIGRSGSFYRAQLAKLKTWPEYGSFVKAMRKGQIMPKLTENGSVGKKFAFLLELTFRLGPVGPYLLPLVNKLIVARARKNSGELVQ